MPEIYNAVDWVYQFTNVHLVIANSEAADSHGVYSVPIATLNIDLTNNAIPVIGMLVDASKSLPDIGAPPSEESLKPKEPTLSSLSNFYKELQKEVNKKEVFATLIATAECNVDRQQLALTLWRIIGVGISGDYSGGSFSPTITLAHPAYDSTLSACWIPNGQNIARIPDSLAVLKPNPPQGFLESCFAYIKQTEQAINDADTSSHDTDVEGDNPSLGKISELLAPRTREACVALARNILWDNAGGVDIPFLNSPEVSSSVEQIIGKAFWGYVGRPTVSVWDVFAGIVCPAFEITVNGDASSLPLVVSPFVPWGKPLVSIYDDEISDLNLPSVDKDPLAAVLAEYHDAASEGDFGMQVSTMAAYEGGSSTVQELNTGGGYLAALEAGVIGKISVFNPPDWARDFLNLRASLNGEGGPEGTTNVLGPDPWGNMAAASRSNTTPPSNPTKEDYTTYRNLLNVWCKQCFFRGYRYAMSVSMRVRLMIENPEFADALPGGRLRPGVTISIRARETDDIIFHFYVTSVKHVIDSQNSQAYTSIQGSYLRSDQQILAGVITESDLSDGIKNTLYDSDGELSVTSEPAESGEVAPPNPYNTTVADQVTNLEEP